MKRLSTVLFLFVFVLLASNTQALTYNYTSMNYPTGSSYLAYCVARGINNSGYIVGDTSYGYTGFIFDGSSYATLAAPAPNVIQAWPAAINNKGQVVGRYQLVGSPYSRGFLYERSTYTSFGPPNSQNTEPYGINDMGQIVGWYYDGTTRRGFIYDGSTYTTLFVPNSLTTEAYGINNAGHVVGTYTDRNAMVRGFIFDGLSYTTLSKSASGINDVCQIVTFDGFVYDGLNYTQLTYPGSLSTSAFDINDSGEVVGSYSITYTATGMQEVTQGYRAQLQNKPPIINPIANKSVNEGQSLQFTVAATDPDGNSLTYSAINLPPGSVFDPASKTFTWTPTYNQAGNYSNIIFRVTDNGNPPLSSFRIMTIIVLKGNKPPVLNAIGNKAIGEGGTLQFTVSGSDPDGNSLSYTASNLPTGATFDSVTQTFTWTPIYTQANSYNVLFTVTDNGVPPMAASETITITVNNVNRPPILTPIGRKDVYEGQTLSFLVTASDPDEGDTLTYSTANLPPGATFDPVTHVFNWVINYDQSNNYENVRFTVTDSGNPAMSASEAITISVGNINRPPVLNPLGNKTINEGQTLEFVVTASDPDGDGLTYYDENLPAGANFDKGTQTFTWTPTYDQAGNYENIEFTVMDNGTPPELSHEVITITVGQINRPPIFNPVGTQQTQTNKVLTFVVSAVDPDGDSITYSNDTLPAGAIFDPVTRIFSWTPAFNQAGSYKTTFYATDSGSPTLKAQIDVMINVDCVLTPPQRVDVIVKMITSLNLGTEMVNSYLANLKKVGKFVEEGRVNAAINELNAFINKANNDLSHAKINSDDGNNLIQMANDVVLLLKGP